MRKNKINTLITKLADKTDNSNEFEVPQPQKKQKIETENFLGQKKWQRLYSKISNVINSSATTKG